MCEVVRGTLSTGSVQQAEMPGDSIHVLEGGETVRQPIAFKCNENVEVSYPGRSSGLDDPSTRSGLGRETVVNPSSSYNGRFILILIRLISHSIPTRYRDTGDHLNKNISQNDNPGAVERVKYA